MDVDESAGYMEISGAAASHGGGSSSAVSRSMAIPGASSQGMPDDFGLSSSEPGADGGNRNSR
jgi:hypothetical protein